MMPIPKNYAKCSYEACEMERSPEASGTLKNGLIKIFNGGNHIHLRPLE